MVRPYAARHACALDIRFQWLVVGPGTKAYDAIHLGYEGAAFGPQAWMMQFHVVQTVSYAGRLSHSTRGRENKRNMHRTDKLHSYTGELCDHRNFRCDYVKDDVGRVHSMNEKHVSKNEWIILKWIFGKHYMNMCISLKHFKMG
jgi:hypothetical protein